MESVEVWMWLIAGLLIGGIVFVAAFQFLGNYSARQEISQAQQNFNSLKNAVNNVCLGGTDTMETRNFMFPFVVSSIFVKPESDDKSCDDDKPKGIGRCICINITKQDLYCEKTKLCEMAMGTLDFDTQSGIFFLIQKALGKKKPSTVRFEIQKINLTTVIINSTKEYTR